MPSHPPSIDAIGGSACRSPGKMVRRIDVADGPTCSKVQPPVKNVTKVPQCGEGCRGRSLKRLPVDTKCWLALTVTNYEASPVQCIAIMHVVDISICAEEQGAARVRHVANFFSHRNKLTLASIAHGYGVFTRHVGTSFTSLYLPHDASI